MHTRESSPPEGNARVDDTLADADLRIARIDRLQRGDALGRYVVLDNIGAGSMGLVYAAYDPELDRRVAIKLLRASMGAQAGTRRSRRLIREAQAMAKLAHPNVVTVHDVGTHEDRVFLAMEHVRGQTLGQWLETRRAWPEVLEVFLAAGRGLAAAHAKGLVHRDFKPDNVMLGDDGRVLVMDFGLARADEGTDSALESEPIEPSSGPSALSARITHTGVMLGTPAYMAPEQHLGRMVDARSDQFSLCVALFEGLYGHRPFAGDTPASVGLSIIGGEITEPQPGHGVPRWLHRAVTRGLAPAPQDRYADIEELLRALQAAPRRRRTLAIAGGTVAVVVLGAALWASAPDLDEPCTDAAARLEGTWSESHRRRVHGAFEASGSAMAAETLARVTDRLERYAREWANAWTNSCEATRVRHEQSEALLELRRACLDERRRALDDLIGVLERADAEVVPRAVDAAADLPPIADCSDLVTLRRSLPPPSDPELARVVRQLRARIARAAVLDRAGRFDEARTLLEDALARAETADYPPVLAEALLVAGRLDSERGAHDDAVQSLSRAFFLAVRAGHDPIAAEAAARLTYDVGYRQARHELGFAWGEHALALGLRVGEDGLPEATAHHALGVLADATGDTERASEHYARAYALRRALLPDDHPDLARSLNALGNLHLDRGELPDALEDYQAALHLREAALGPNHPAVAGSLNNVSIILRRQGDHAGAIAALQRALAIYEAIHGENHPNVAQSRNNLGLTLRDGGDPAAAEVEHRRALAIREQILEPAHPDLGDSLLGLGRALVDQDRPEDAEPLLRRALTLYEDAFGSEHPAVAEARLGLGLALLDQGRHAQAEPVLSAALAPLRARELHDDLAEVTAALARARAGPLEDPRPTGSSTTPSAPRPD